MAYLYVIYVIINAPDLNSVFTVPSGFGRFQALLILLVFLLMILNWSIEGIKWSYLLKSCYNLSFKRSLRSVLAGTTAGMATPNRLGEFAGRILFIPRENRANAALLSITGSFTQLFVTLFFGLAAFINLIIYVPASRGVFAVNDWIIIAVSVACMALMLWFYGNTKLLARVVSKIGFLKNKLNFSKTDLVPGARKKWLVLLLSAFRYVIFVHQFYIMIVLFGIDTSYVETMQAVMCIYLLMAIIPVISAGEPGVRGTVSIVLFSLFTDQPATVFSASISLWLINLAIPALIGSFLLFQNKKNEST